MKIAILSDTHTYHDSVIIPECDILIHCGDISIYGERWEVNNFIEWFGNQKAKYKIFINGNHEVQVFKASLDSNGGVTRQIVNHYNTHHSTEIYYLENSGVQIEGLKIWGSPYTPEFYDWAYMYSRNGEGTKIWSKIPEDTDVLITHGPPETILDKVYPVGKYTSPFGGCPYLLERVSEVKPKLHCFGHIHRGYGYRKLDNPKFSKTLFVNAATCNEDYKPVNRPIIVDTETWEIVNEEEI